MDRIEELKDKIEKAAKELAVIKEKAEKEEREFTEEEIEKANRLADEIDSNEISLNSLLAEERTNDRLQSLREPKKKAIRPDLEKAKESRKFGSFGEFLQAVYYAGIGGAVDTRLNYQARAASGLGEGVPSDGGLA